MSATMKKLVKYMEERISYDQKYDETSEELNEDNTPKFLMYSNNHYLHYLNKYVE